MTNPQPVLVEVLDDEALVPIGEHHRRLFNEMFLPGHRYEIIPHAGRSGKSHRHYFSCIREAWKNLPEKISDDYPDAETLRKRTLIKLGYCDQADIVCGSHEAALGAAAACRRLDRYAVIVARDSVVRIITAQSQDTKSMGRKAFQESKQAVIEELAAMVGITVDELAKNADRAA